MLTKEQAKKLVVESFIKKEEKEFAYIIANIEDWANDGENTLSEHIHFEKNKEKLINLGYNLIYSNIQIPKYKNFYYISWKD